MNFATAERLRQLPPYLFAELDAKKAALQAKGMDLISLSIADPDQPTPEPIVAAMQTAVRDGATHVYPSYQGAREFRAAACDWMAKHYDAAFNPDTECLALIGSKEGIAHFPWAFLNPGDVALVPDPGYPVYASSTIFAGGVPHFMPLRPERGFLPDFAAIPANVLRRARLLFLNYPNNPTGAVATRAFFAEAVALAQRHKLIIAHDAAYLEIFFDGQRPPSIFSVPGAREVAIEFHSLSKTFNMTGWRLGWAVGNPELVQGLAKLKTNLDSGCFTAVQRAGAVALTTAAGCVEEIRARYQRRRDRLIAGLRGIGWAVEPPQASFYVWTRVPTDEDSMAFVTRLMETTGVILTPGIGFGVAGEGFVRFPLTVPEAQLDEAVARLARFV